MNILKDFGNFKEFSQHESKQELIEDIVREVELNSIEIIHDYKDEINHQDMAKALITAALILLDSDYVFARSVIDLDQLENAEFLNSSN